MNNESKVLADESLIMMKPVFLNLLYDFYKNSKDNILKQNILKVFSIVELAYGTSEDTSIYSEAGIEEYLSELFIFIQKDNIEENVIYINKILENITSSANYYSFEYRKMARLLEMRFEQEEK